MNVFLAIDNEDRCGSDDRRKPIYHAAAIADLPMPVAEIVHTPLPECLRAEPDDSKEENSIFIRVGVNGHGSAETAVVA